MNYTIRLLDPYTGKETTQTFRKIFARYDVIGLVSDRYQIEIVPRDLHEIVYHDIVMIPDIDCITWYYLPTIKPWE